jgi:hypothetical protein
LFFWLRQKSFVTDAKLQVRLQEMSAKREEDDVNDEEEPSSDEVLH